MGGWSGGGRGQVASSASGLAEGRAAVADEEFADVTQQRDRAPVVCAGLPRVVGVGVADVSVTCRCRVLRGSVVRAASRRVGLSTSLDDRNATGDAGGVSARALRCQQCEEE